MEIAANASQISYRCKCCDPGQDENQEDVARVMNQKDSRASSEELFMPASSLSAAGT
jgi:hypothetical protein